LSSYATGATGGEYASTVSKSLVMTELIDLLKFQNISYPYVVTEEIFEDIEVYLIFKFLQVKN